MSKNINVYACPWIVLFHSTRANAMDIRRFLKSRKTPSPSTNSSTCAVPEPDPQVSAPIDVENASERAELQMLKKK